jgi:hypothetical protein
VTKIYVGNLPFGRTDETAKSHAPASPLPKTYVGTLREGVPSSALPQDLRRELDSGKEVALAQIRAALNGRF